MEPSKHAKKRMQQRGFRSQTLELLLTFGRLKTAKGGANKLFIGNNEYAVASSELKKAIQLLDKVRNKTIVFSEDTIITVYYSY